MIKKRKKREPKYECLSCGYIRPGPYCFCPGHKGFKRTNKKLTISPLDAK